MTSRLVTLWDQKPGNRPTAPTQIIKGNRNSKLMKDEETSEKLIPREVWHESYKTTLSPCTPSLGTSCGEYCVPRVPAGSHATISQKKRLENRERSRIRC